MDKKIIKALFDCASKDQTRPVLQGVFFEKDRCVVSDTHILVVYNEGSEKHAGKIILENGEIVKGVYPDYNRIIPKKVSDPLHIDCGQLLRACSWWNKRSENNNDDMLVIRNTGLCIKRLAKLLGLFALTHELSTMALCLNPNPGRPVLATSEMFTAMLMPSCYKEEDVDAEREEGSYATVSYSNLINTYALEITKPKEQKPDSMSWL